MFTLLFSKIRDGFISILPIYFLVIILNFTPYISLSLYEVGVLTFATVLAGLGIALFNSIQYGG